MLFNIRFVGGGCPGNAHLVSQLLNGREMNDVLQHIGGIACRNGTSCPDQLARAIVAVKEGRLTPAASFVVLEDHLPANRTGLIGELAGNLDVLTHVVEAISQSGVETVICMGNLTGPSALNRQVLKTVRKFNLRAIQGPSDWNYAHGKERPPFPLLDPPERDWLIRLPQVRTFRVGQKRCLAFFGAFIQTLPGYSDYDPYALEMNMICGLTDFMQDETVFPALEAMTPQFLSDVIIFSQARQWGHWRVGGKDIIRVGPAAQAGGVSWGLLENMDGEIEFRSVQTRR